MKKEPKLDPEKGEVICEKCDGKGTRRKPGHISLLEICPTCNGAGKLDWVENVTGRKRTVPMTKDVRKAIISIINSKSAEDVDKKLLSEIMLAGGKDGIKW